VNLKGSASCCNTTLLFKDYLQPRVQILLFTLVTIKSSYSMNFLLYMHSCPTYPKEVSFVVVQLTCVIRKVDMVHIQKHSETAVNAL